MSARWSESASARLRMLSVKEPWASEIASGKKTVELRSYAIGLGPIGIASTASGSASGRLLCVVDVVEVLPPNHPWLASQGIRGLYGNILRNPRAGSERIAVSGKQGIWYLDVTGDWARIAGGGGQEQQSTSSRWDRLKDKRTRADKLRDLANAATATKGERDNALAELARMKESANVSSATPSPPPPPPPPPTPSTVDPFARATTLEKLMRERAERYEAQQRKQAEERAAREQAKAEMFAQIQRENAEREAKQRGAKEWAAREFDRVAKIVADNEAAKAAAAQKRRAEEQGKVNVMENSPFRVRGGGDPKDACPACRADSALGLEKDHEDPSRRRYRCDRCDQRFSLIKPGAVDFWMYRRDDVRAFGRGYQG